MGTDTSELISTIDHNITGSPEDAFFQRKASYDNIPEELLPVVRENVRKMSEDFIELVNTVISRYDRDVCPHVDGEAERKKNGRRKAGLGIFYFE